MSSGRGKVETTALIWAAFSVSDSISETQKDKALLKSQSNESSYLTLVGTGPIPQTDWSKQMNESGVNVSVEVNKLAVYSPWCKFSQFENRETTRIGVGKRTPSYSQPRGERRSFPLLHQQSRPWTNINKQVCLKWGDSEAAVCE